jgi:hypothetical protein
MVTLYQLMLLNATNCHCLPSFIFSFLFNFLFLLSQSFCFHVQSQSQSQNGNHNHMLATQSTRITSQSSTRITIQSNHKTLRKIHKNHNTIIKSSSKNHRRACRRRPRTHACGCGPRAGELPRRGRPARARWQWPPCHLREGPPGERAAAGLLLHPQERPPPTGSRRASLGAVGRRWLSPTHTILGDDNGGLAHMSCRRLVAIQPTAAGLRASTGEDAPPPGHCTTAGEHPATSLCASAGGGPASVRRLVADLASCSGVCHPAEIEIEEVRCEEMNKRLG